MYTHQLPSRLRSSQTQSSYHKPALNINNPLNINFCKYIANKELVILPSFLKQWRVTSAVLRNWDPNWNNRQDSRRVQLGRRSYGWCLTVHTQSSWDFKSCVIQMKTASFGSQALLLNWLTMGCPSSKCIRIQQCAIIRILPLLVPWNFFRWKTCPKGTNRWTRQDGRSPKVQNNIRSLKSVNLSNIFFIFLFLRDFRLVSESHCHDPSKARIRSNKLNLFISFFFLFRPHLFLLLAVNFWILSS